MNVLLTFNWKSSMITFQVQVVNFIALPKLVLVNSFDPKTKIVRIWKKNKENVIIEKGKSKNPIQHNSSYHFKLFVSYTLE